MSEATIRLWMDEAGEQRKRAEAAEASLAEAKRLHREEMLAVYDECEGVAAPAHPAPYRQVELYRQAIRQLKARFLSQEPHHERCPRC